jgi:predicted transcriptional regulator
MPDIEIELDDELEARLTALAEKRGVTVEELASEIICRGIEMEPEAEAK